MSSQQQQAVVSSTESPWLDRNTDLDFILQVGQPANDAGLASESGNEAEFNADVFG